MMTADEKLARLRARYHGIYTIRTSPCYIGAVKSRRRTAIAEWPNGSFLRVVGEDDAAALDALAEALAKLEVEVVVEYHSGASVGVNAAKGKCPKCGGVMMCIDCNYNNPGN